MKTEMFKSMMDRVADATGWTEKHSNLVLVCWQCGNRRPILVDRPPQSSMELIDIALKAGYVGSIDTLHSRSLIFCSDGCMQMAKRKDGQFRLRPTRIGHA